MPKFSVIIPIYNVEQYLFQCIDSILVQDYTDFEVILVDDGSTDCCPNICDEYQKKDSRIKVIHKKNAGVSLARQDGISIAKGDYLVFVDADDRITEGFFEAISMHTDVDIIRFGCIVEHPDGSLINRLPKEREGFYEKSDIESEIYPYLIQSKSATYYCPSLWCHVFKRELFITNMVKDRIIKIGEDGACVIPCVYYAKSLFCIHKCLYVYNYNETSATKGRKVYPWDGPILIAEHLKERMDMTKYDFQQQLDRKIVHELFSVVVSQFNRKEKYSIITREIKQKNSESLYAEAISQAEFTNTKARLVVFALRNNLFLLIKLYNRMR